MKNKSTILFITIIILPFGYLLSQNDKINLLKHHNGSVEDSLAYEVLFNQFKKHLNSNFDSAYYFANELCMTSLRIGDSLKIVRAYHARGDMQMERGEINSGIEDMELALAVANRNKYDDRAKYILNNLAIAFTYKGNFDQALKYNFESLKIRERDKSLGEIGVANNNIGLIYYELKDFRNAMNYFKESLRLAVESKNTHELEVLLANIGYCNLGIGDNEEAINYFEQALTSCEDRCKDIGYIVCYIGLGSGYLKTGDYEISESYLKQAIQLTKKSNDLRHWSSGARTMAELYLMQNRYEEARAFIQEAYELTLGTDLKSEHLDNLNILSVVLEASGDYQKSIHYQTEYLKLLNEITSGEMINNFSQVISAFDQKVNLSTIERQKELIELQEERSSLLEIILVISMLALLLLIAVGVLLWRAIKMKSRINIQLDQKVRHRTAELEQSYKQLQKSNFEQKENLIRLYSKVGSALATMRGLAETAKKDLGDERGLDYISKMEEQTEKIQDISSKING
ncbi:MAG: tetratricopeptide repeat protein [Cyclobacteriaceae bacterium]|nr:tetratricopeptide repeat protein [Cyclobacteriaceae bacterium]